MKSKFFLTTALGILLSMPFVHGMEKDTESTYRVTTTQTPQQHNLNIQMKEGQDVEIKIVVKAPTGRAPDSPYWQQEAESLLYDPRIILARKYLDSVGNKEFVEKVHELRPYLTPLKFNDEENFFNWLTSKFWSILDSETLQISPPPSDAANKLALNPADPVVWSGLINQRYLASFITQLWQIWFKDYASDRLQIGGKDLSTDSIRALAFVLTKDNSIKILDLGESAIEEGGAKELSDLLLKNNTIEEMNLNQHPSYMRGPIKDAGAMQLAIALHENETLKVLDLQNNQLTSLGATSIADSLRLNSGLQILKLNSNKIGNEGAISLIDSLLGNNHLTELHLATNQITYLAVQEGMSPTTNNTTLTTLSLTNNSFQPGGLEALKIYLPFFKALKNLSINSSQIDDQSMQFLGIGLAGNTSLEDLNLSMNRITSQGGEILKSILQSSPLKSLNMRDNLLGNEGVSKLAEALQNNNSLTRLDLAGNSISDIGVINLSTIIPNNRTLTHLDLQRNPFGYEGVKALREAIQARASNNKVLKTVYLSIAENDGQAGEEVRRIRALLNS